MSSIVNKLKEINKVSFLPKGYKTNNTIFRIAITLIAVFLLYLAYTMPEDRAYFSCNYVSNEMGFSMPCDNPFYLASPCPFVDSHSCTLKEVQVGMSLGQPPGQLYNLAFLLSLLILGLAVVLNHFLYNSKFKFEEDKHP